MSVFSRFFADPSKNVCFGSWHQNNGKNGKCQGKSIRFRNKLSTPCDNMRRKSANSAPIPDPSPEIFPPFFPTKSGVLQLLLRARQIRRGRGRRICGRGPQDEGSARSAAKLFCAPKGRVFYPLLEGVTSAPCGRKIELGRALRGTPSSPAGALPLRERTLLSGGFGKPPPPRRLCRQPPLHKGAVYGAAALSRPALAFCGGERYNHLL